VWTTSTSLSRREDDPQTHSKRLFFSANNREAEEAALERISLSSGNGRRLRGGSSDRAGGCRGFGNRCGRLRDEYRRGNDIGRMGGWAARSVPRANPRTARGSEAETINSSLADHPDHASPRVQAGLPPLGIVFPLGGKNRSTPNKNLTTLSNRRSGIRAFGVHQFRL
jgi:hypothetical protein